MDNKGASASTEKLASAPPPGMYNDGGAANPFAGGDRGEYTPPGEYAR
jgi:hypothetical protein